MQPKREKEKEKGLKSFKYPLYPNKTFSWNSDVLFHFHLLPAAVAFVCICCDTEYQLSYTLILTAKLRAHSVKSQDSVG